MENVFDPVEFGKQVKRFRESHDCDCPKCDGSLGVRPASKQIGISSATLSRVERGQPPSIEVFARLLQWMDVSFYWLKYKRGQS